MAETADWGQQGRDDHRDHFAYNEAVLLAPCLFSLLSQTRPPDEILVINNASTDETGAVARAVPGVRVVDEPLKGLVMAREAARRITQSDILAYVDADCRAPIMWLERVERAFERRPSMVACRPVSILRLGLDRSLLVASTTCSSRRRRTPSSIISGNGAFCAAATSRCAGRLWPGSVVSIAPSSFTARTPILDGG
jgi:glycosyltransferase involved in cell wall biosynthesis